jgi:anti-sigma B factor antagonist
MIEGHSEEGTYLARAEGEFNIYTAAENAVRLRQAIEEHATIVLDLSMVSEMDTAGVQLLIQTWRTCDAQDKILSFVRPSAAVQDIVRLLRLHEFLGMPEDVETAEVQPEVQS